MVQTLSRFHINPVNLDFNLPDELIAQEPLKKRETARLMVLNRATESIQHRHFKDLTELFGPNDVLALNKTKVNKAKLLGRKKTGGRVELLLIGPTGRPNEWRCLVRPELKVGTVIDLEDGTQVVMVSRNETGENILMFEGRDPQLSLMEKGRIPLPPYIKRTAHDSRESDDEVYYQTVYAKVPGSLAAPTAGLHFSQSLLEDLKRNGVTIVEIILHVGWGTFKPISKSLDEHEMLGENYEVEPDAFQILKEAKMKGRRIIGVGTTVTRVLESISLDVPSPPLKGETKIFIRPGFKFRWLDGLITNFHVPRSTPIALTSTFCGFSFLEKAYEVAIQENYRFFSYGDAMMIV
jgi:S-adenosylmethionine:tRNA ribosyltransferase-isomerase